MRLLARIFSLAAGLAIFGLLALPSLAREPDDSDGLCWSSEIEFPVPCDEDEE